MPTFSELQIELKKLQNRKAILTYLVEHIDDKFLAASGEEAKNKLLGTDGLPVPEEAFEILVDNTLIPNWSRRMLRSRRSSART
jgi:hypothetical protein